MAILIIDQHGTRQAGTLNGRVLIGRWPENTVVIDDKTASRIHAWVGVQDGQYYIADTGSRTGTIVNDEPLQERRLLSDGDQNRIGPAVLYYFVADEMPPEASEIDLTPRSAEELSGTHGVFMDCVCGAPLWLPPAFRGIGQCRYCGHTVELRGPGTDPGPPPVPPEFPATTKPPASNVDEGAESSRPKARIKPMPPAGRRVPPPAPISRSMSQSPGAPPIAQPIPNRPATAPPAVPEVSRPAQETACGVCHSAITVFDEVTACPSCGVMFHTDCWTENHGCSSYGCAQVGVLERR